MRTWRLILVGCLVFCFCAGLAQAQVVKKSQGGLDDLVAASPRLSVHQVVVPLEALRSEAAAMAAPGMDAVAAGWDRFLSENGSRWELSMDRRTGRPALASGSGVPWIPGIGNSLTNGDIRESLGPSGEVTRGTLVRLAKKFMRQYPELFGVEMSDLAVASGGGTGEYGGYLWYVQFNRQYHGIPVENAYVVFRVNHGNLVQFGGEFTGPIHLDPLPTISIETAQQILAGYLGGMNASDQWLDEGRLSVLPLAPQGDSGAYNALPGGGVDYHLVYTLTFRRDGTMGTWEAKVDAHTGEVLAFRDANMYGSVNGGIYPTSNLDTEVVRPMPYAGVSGSYANAAGVYPQASGSVSASFTGKYVKVTDSCGASALAGTAPADLSFGTSTGTDCTTPGTGGAGNTHSARSGYYHLTLWKIKAMAWLPSNTWLTGQVGDNVNLNQTCNAYWNGSSVNFFKSGGGCSNTGELPTVFLHEIGHGLDSNDGSPSSTVGSSESYGDLTGILATHSSCLGINFIPGQQCSGYGNACTSCTGIRDADYTKHTNSTSPATPAQLAGTTGFHCTTSSTYPGPCGYEGHCESYIMSEVGWDLAAKDLPAAGFDANTSWYIADRLFYLTRPTAGDSYTCSGTTANGCGTSNWHKVYLVADDDNGNLSDGTPHAAAIYAAFNRHLIACTTSTSANSTTCGAIGQPTLTATAGSGSVSLSWTAASGAAKYTVLRNELGATAGMAPLATVTSGTTYSDTVVATGVTYYYTVAGVGASASCFGKLSSVQSATPTAGTTYSISGAVSGATLSGVAVSTTGASTTTDASGAYTLSGLANGTYTVTPAKSGYTFAPVNISVTISGASQTGKNFTATATGGGDTVLTSGVGVTGSVALNAYNYYTITVPSGATNIAITLTGLSADIDLYANNSATHPTTSTYYGRSWNGGTTSESLSYASPTAGPWSIAAYGYAAGSYTVTATITTGTVTYSISGTVSGAATSGVTMSLTGAGTGTTTTAAGGTYTFSGLANGAYTVTPSKAGYTFAPVNIAVTLSGASQTGKNFTATATGGGDTVLTSGVGVSGSVALNAYAYYTITVPSGATNIAITLTGLSADIDLYANNSATHPTTATYYGSSANGGTTSESLSYASPTAGPWSIAAYGYAAGSYTVTATITTGGGTTTQILLNPGFESGANGQWTISTSPTAHTVMTTVASPAAPHGGTYDAQLGAYNTTGYNSQTDSIRQTVTISSAATAATLNFWYYIKTNETTTTTAYDKLTVTVENTSGTVLATLITLSNLNKTSAWTQKTGLNLLAYKGQTVVVRFKATTDSSLTTWFLLDDAALNVTQ